jgi:myo-inositol-1(or 4)-monophosphatase
MMHPMLNTAVKAARKAGSIINRASLDVDKIIVERKRQNDFVSEVDRNAEEAIIEILQEAYPEHGILAEESGVSRNKSGLKTDYQWIIDPLDGTTNFLHGFPHYAVSIALAKKGVLEQAVVFDPTKNELFTASRGRGAYLNDRRIRISKTRELADALIGTGFPYRDFSHLGPYMAMFRELTQKAAGLRRPGAASLDLAYVACGRFDGFFEIGLSPWDIAGGALLILEAGGLVGDPAGEQGYLESGHIIAANPKVFAQLVQISATHLESLHARNPGKS